MRYVNKHNTESHWFGLVKIQDTRFPGTTLGLIKHKVPKYNRQKSNSKKKVQPSVLLNNKRMFMYLTRTKQINSSNCQVKLEDHVQHRRRVAHRTIRCRDQPASDAPRKKNAVQ